MSIRCITNNPYIIKMGIACVEAKQGNVFELLSYVKKEVQNGYNLITHPLTGSIRPDISPYKSIILSSRKGNIDLESMKIIENSINYALNLSSNNLIKWDKESLEDFELIDYEFIKGLLNIN